METQKEVQEVQTLGSRQRLWFDGSVPRFKVFNGREDVELSKLFHKSASKFEGGRIAKKVTLTLAHMCTEIAGARFFEEQASGYKELMGLPEREKHIANMWQTDVLVAYMMLRYDVRLTGEITMQIPSPYDPDKKRECTWTANLDSLPFVGHDSVEKSLWTYHLKRPTTIRGKAVDHLVLGPQRWATAEKIKFEAKPYEANQITIVGSIHEIPQVHKGSNMPYSIEDLELFHKVDLDEIGRQIGKNHSGIDFSIEVLDEVVERTFESTVPWLHPDFLA